MKINMKRLFLMPFILVPMILSVSCKKEMMDLAAKNGVKVNIRTEGEFVEVKSAETQVDVNDFKVTIKDANSIIVNSWEKFSDMPSVVSLNPGSYTIEASSPGNLPVAFDQPVFKGSQNFDILAGNIEQIDMTCSLTNMKVTVIPTDKFYNEMNDDFSIIVTSEIGHLVFNKEITQAGRSGYFDVTPKLDVHIQGTRKVNNAPVNHYITITECAARDHHILKIDAVETGDLTFGGSGIVVDYTLNDREENIVIDGWDEEDVDDNNPEQPDPDAPITISAPGVDEMLVLTDAQAAGAEVNVTITAEKGIKELWVDIQSEYLKGMLEAMELPSKFNMADLSDPATREFIEGLGLLAQGEVSGATEYSFSIGAFMPLIDSSAENPIHTFVITVKDSEDNEKQVSMVIKRIP